MICYHYLMTLCHRIMAPGNEAEFLEIAHKKQTTQQYCLLLVLLNTPVWLNQLSGKPNRQYTRDEIVMTWCQTGYTWSTHSYIMKQQEKHTCKSFKLPFNIKPFFLDCNYLATIRLKHSTVQPVFEQDGNVALPCGHNRCKGHQAVMTLHLF